MTRQKILRGAIIGGLINGAINGAIQLYLSGGLGQIPPTVDGITNDTHRVWIRGALGSLLGNDPDRHCLCDAKGGKAPVLA